MSAYHPLLRLDSPTPVLSVDTTRTVAQNVLDGYAATNIHDHNATVEAAVALGNTLRSLLAALDAERGTT